MAKGGYTKLSTLKPEATLSLAISSYVSLSHTHSLTSVEGVGDGDFAPSPPGVPPVQRNRKSESKRESERQRERERWNERERDRQTDRQTDRERGKD